MRRNKGYTDELEKLTRYDSDIQLTIKLKKAATKKNEDKSYGLFSGQILLLIS